MKITPEAPKAKPFSVDHPPDPDFLKSYRKAFAPSPYSPFAIETKRRGWHTETNPNVYLTDARIADHLDGDYYVGPIPKTFARTLVIDLDAHTRRTAQTLDTRTADVLAAFPEAAPLAFSSPSGGRHLHYVLSNPCWSDQLRAFGVDRLKGNDVVLASGQVEVYPDGGRAIRAPLGRDCYLLDDTMVPVDGHRVANLHSLADVLENQRYDTLTVPTDYQATLTPADSPTGHRRRSGASTGEYMQRVDRMLRVGIGPGETNGPDGALLTLRWYFFMVYGWSADRVEHELIGFMEVLGKASRTWQRSPEQVRRKIRHLVHKDWDPAKVGALRSRKSTGVGQTAIERYVDSQPLDGRERAFLAKVLRYAHVRGTDTLDGQLEVQIPSRNLQSYNRQYGPIMRLLIRQGLVEVACNYGAQIGRCKTYRLACLDRCPNEARLTL